MLAEPTKFARWNSDFRRTQLKYYCLLSFSCCTGNFDKIWFAWWKQGFQHTEWRTNMNTYNYIKIHSKIANKIHLIPTKKYADTLRKRYTIPSLHNMSVQVRCLLQFPKWNFSNLLSRLYHGRVKRLLLLISNVSEGNTTLGSGQHVAREIQVEPACWRVCTEIAAYM
jgi:hypothetical protein